MSHPNKPRLKDGNEREPPPGRKVPIGFRPPNSFLHMVADRESWQSLGTRYKVPPMKIIQDNFGTTVPEEINWYLNHYVDCDSPTPDRYNWRFSTSARRGTSPRAGIVYVVPNWPVIFPGVKKATRAAVNLWFSQTSMKGGRVVGRSLWIPGNSLMSEWRQMPRFKFELEWAGAPTALADAISEVVREVLGTFTRAVNEFQPDAFAVAPRQSVQVQHLIPWPLLSSGAGTPEVVEAANLRRLLNNRLGKDAAVGMQAVAEYARWFDGSFKLFRHTTMAKQVAVMMLPRTDPRRPPEGIATGFPATFLHPGTMPDVV